MRRYKSRKEAKELYAVGKCRCTDCLKVKNVAAFPKNRQNKLTGHHYYCLSCNSMRSKESYKKPHVKARIKRSQRKWFESPRGRVSQKRSRYKLSRGFGRFSYAKSRAKKLGWSFTLLRPEYEFLIKQACFYCSGPLPETSVGLDRLDHLRGYEINNVVPCCRPCNVAKSDHFTVDEMVTILGPAIREIRCLREKQGREWTRGVSMLKLVVKD